MSKLVADGQIESRKLWVVATQNWVVPRIYIRPCHSYGRDFL